MATYQGLVKLGTLRNGSTVMPRPTKPWKIDSEPYSDSGLGPGDIANFTTDPNILNWNIGDTDATETNKLQWHKIVDGTKILLICDRVILVNVSWDDLNADNRVFGKTVIIDGKSYTLRLLSVGDTQRSGGQLSGATPTTNEWDRFITNEDVVSGLPTPTSTDFDGNLTAADYSGTHNSTWNWISIASIGQEASSTTATSRANRGFFSPRYFSAAPVATRSVSLGWRPVLESLNTPPTINLTSPADNMVLTEGAAYTITGTATDINAGDIVAVKYRINTGPIRSIVASVSDGSTPIPFNLNLTYKNKRLYLSLPVHNFDLAENTTHTLTIWSEDSQGGISSSVTRNFTVIWNRPPVISGADADLGTLTAPPAITYSATEPENQTITITEYMDGVQTHTFTATAGQNYTYQLSTDQWLRLSLGSHQIKIRATDSAGLYSERIYTFTRAETRIQFELKFTNPATAEFFTLDAKPTRFLFTLEGSIPAGANLLVEVCNNYLDEYPTWEEITGPVRAGRGYIFQSAIKTAAQWAINVRVTIDRGTAIDPIIINGFGGAFD